MKDIAQKYGFVSVADFKEISNERAGVRTAACYLDNIQGWTLEMLNTKAHIARMRNGYTLRLPNPLSIN